MTSKRQQNAGYLLPTPVTGYDTICLTVQIPNERRYRAAVIGHLYQLANWWTWEKSYVGNDTRARDAAAMMRRLLVDTLMLQDCGSGGTPIVTPSGCVPIGSPFMLFVPDAPAGALPMDGVPRLKTDYPELVPMLPAAWVSETTFTLKDMTGRTLAGQGFNYRMANGDLVLQPSGSANGQTERVMSIGEMPTHSHQERTAQGLAVEDNGFTGGYSVGWTPAGTPYTPLHTADRGQSDPHNNMPPFVAGYWFIQATNCPSQTSGEFDIRLSGCLLEYTLNGSMWFVVDGWTNYDNCLNIPLPFDLRFNNCVLEYSRDSAQTWSTVPGWADVAACIDTNETYDLRLQDGLLQWSKDRGEDWATVTGWETGITEVINEGDRCLNAWGAQHGLKVMVGNYLELFQFTNTTLGEFSADVLAKWSADFPGITPPNQLETFIQFCWAVPNHLALWSAVSYGFSDDTLAAYIYSAFPSGNWCEQSDFYNYFNCEGTPTWVAAIMLLVEAMSYLSYEDNLLWQAKLFQMRDYGTCHECADLEVIELCAQQPTQYSACWNFAEGAGGWSPDTEIAGCYTIANGGLFVDGNACETGPWASEGFELQVPVGIADIVVSVTGAGVEITPGNTFTLGLNARVAGILIGVDANTSTTSGETITASGAIPAGATEIRISAYCGSANSSVVLKTVSLLFKSLTNPFSGHPCQG